MKHTPEDPGSGMQARILKKIRNDAVLKFHQINRPMNLFSLNPSGTCLVIVDMQNFSCIPATTAGFPGIGDVIRRINRFAGFCRQIGVPVIWVRHAITPDAGSTGPGLYPEFHDKEQLAILYDHNKGTEIYSGMEVDTSRDHVVMKNRYSAFQSNPPELKEKLDSLHRTQLVIAGIAANVCVESTIRDAMQLDYEVVLISDCTTTFDEVLLEATMKNTLHFFGDVRSADEIMGELHENCGKNGTPAGDYPPHPADPRPQKERTGRTVRPARSPALRKPAS